MTRTCILQIIFFMLIFIFNSKLLFASDFEYVGPGKDYKYSYSFHDKDRAFDIVSRFSSGYYINKKIMFKDGIQYSLYVKNNSVMIMGDFEETLISNNEKWIQNVEKYSLDNGIFISKNICNKYYVVIDNKYDLLFVVKECINIVREEVYLKNVGLILNGGYSKDFGRDLNEYAFISSIEGENIDWTYIDDIKQIVFETLEKYEINRSTQQNTSD